MRSLVLLLALFTLFTFITALGAEEDKIEINTILMHKTFKIEWPSHELGKENKGTVFLFNPLEREPVLVTAAHVFENMAGDTAKLHLRKKVSEGKYEKKIVDLQIQKNNQPLCTCHPDVDIAVMPVTLSSYIPGGKNILEEELLATDELLRLWEIHPGDELFCLGYPCGMEAYTMGFPILRSGKIRRCLCTIRPENFDIIYSNGGVR